MKLALEEAEKAYQENEVPVGAVLIDGSGKVIAKAHNNKEKEYNPCGHAEIEVLKKSASELKNWRLNGHTLVVTLEPCVMCMGAMIQARIEKLVFGAYDPKGGALSLGYDIHNNSKLNHKFSIVGGLAHYRCSKILSQFFKQRRGSNR
jgi:tRNA(adenine34) deaminase